MDAIEQDETPELPTEREKAIRLFTYLKDLCALRTTQVRNVASYDQVFWLNDLPRNKLCRALIWRVSNPTPQAPEQHSDPWIEIRKPALKSPPEIPDELEPWIKQEQLTDSSLNEPEIHERIPLSSLQGDSVNTEPTVLVSINDYPDVFGKWIEYVDTSWKPWANEDRELQKVQKAYNQLFSIYQRQEKLGEQYEVVVGAGLLSWKSPNSREVKRHILAIQARVEFDRVTGVVSAGAALDGPQPMLECGMLETADRPNPTDLTNIEKDVASLDGDPWDAIKLECILRGFANSLPVAGIYTSSFEHTGGASETPVVRVAPALILRKRTQRTFEDFYRQIIDQVRDGEDIPENIRRIIDIIEDPPFCHDGTDTEAPTTASALSDSELYFPLPANEAQKKIIRTIAHRRGILVQGPPGTGKSHTICNLIAHFLAQGKRILVTSETPRALEVLRHKIRKEMQEIEQLCVVWLGSGPDSQDALKRSVAGITQRKANWDAAREHAQVEQCVQRLDGERREQARLRHDLRACRELDIYQHASVFGCYSGTLQQIAMQISQERDQFQWLEDRPPEAAEPDLTPHELLRMVEIHRKLTPEIVEQIKCKLYPIDQLVSPDEFSRLVDAEQTVRIAHEEIRDDRNYPGYSYLATLDRQTRDAISRISEGILATQETFAKHFQPWAERMCREVSGDHDRIWRHILDVTVNHVERIEHLLKEHDTLDVTGLGARSLRLVAEHASALRDHLAKGNWLGIWIFRPRVVKDALYLIRSVTVSGRPCDNLQALTQLTAWIEMSTRISALADLWKGITTPPVGDALLLCSAYRDLCEPIEQAVVLHNQIEEVRKICHDFPGIRLPAWHSQTEVRAFCKALVAANKEEDFLTAQAVFTPLAESLTTFIGSGHSHPSTGQLQQAVNARDSGGYRNAYESLSSLHTWATDYSVASDIHSRLLMCAPQTCKRYDASRSEAVWDERFAMFTPAWIWAKTDRWLEEASDYERPKRLQRTLDASASRERNALKNLAASKAWLHCIANLREKERMALVAWSLAVAKIRSGTGKYAETHRETARQELDKCRRAIPAWVMPLYQVVQTIRPGRHQFDVVIIDEASQSGPEAIFLNYIADKLIVVGDDKQITPMHVGVDRSSVEFLRRKYLKDIPHQESLDLDGSLFSQAELRFPDRIRLREHFRCMPEIIQFSNNLSYTTEPLIALRQYGAGRLEPLQTVFVKDGYRKGSSDDVENPPEAEAIVAKIAECCEDPAYANKTFGVISLMGSRQAELINALLMGKNGIGPQEMEKRRLVCGRPYDFQGDEREVMFLSMVDAPQDGQPCRMIRDDDARRRFNVAASRAKDQLWLFHSATLNDLNPACLRYRLLEYCQNPATHQPDEIGETTLAELRRMACDTSTRQRTRRGDGVPGTPFDSWFEVDVFFKIIDRGYRVLPQHRVDDYRIDLVVVGLKGRLAVECDGDEWHGADRFEADTARQRDLQRYGWEFCRIRGGDFYRDSEAALAELWQTLERFEITPRYTWESDRQRSETPPTVEDRAPNTNTGDECQESTEDDADDEGNTAERTERSSSDEPTIGQFELALGCERPDRRRPEDMPPQDIQNAILQSLRECPNNSCTVKSLTSRVLKTLGILTRGNPRLEFEKRVMRNLAVLKAKEKIKEYKAKNIRVRLLG